MKVIIYGNNGEAMLRVKQIFQDLIDETFMVFTGEGKVGSITDLEHAEPDAVVFVGVCPEEQVRIAKTIGLQVFVLLAPVDSELSKDVVISQTRTLAKKDELRKEFENFFDRKTEELISLKKRVG